MRLFLLLISAIPSLLAAQDKVTEVKSELIVINEKLFSDYALQKNTAPLEKTATDDFILIAPTGALETKRQAISGVKNLDIQSIEVTVDEVLVRDRVGVVIGVVEMKGMIMNRPVPGKLRFSSTFVREGDNWKLLSRAVIPMRRP